MGIETLQILSTVVFVLSIVFLIVAIILFIVFDIPRLFREITGIAANQGIKKYNFKTPKGESGELKSGKKKINMSKIMTTSGNLKELDSSQTYTSFKTEKLKPDISETVLLTSAISNNNTEEYLMVVDANKKFSVIKELGYTNSTEIIEWLNAEDILG